MLLVLAAIAAKYGDSQLCPRRALPAREAFLLGTRSPVYRLELAPQAQVTVPAAPVLPLAPSQIKGKQMIDRAIVALGDSSFTHMRSLTTYGRVYGFFHDKLSGLDFAHVYREYDDELPAKGLGVKERQVLGKKQDYSYLYLPDQGWDISFRGARPIPDESWQKYVRGTQNDILYILRFRMKEPGLQFDYVGSDVFLSTHVEVIEVSDAHDITIRVYFDHNTMLPIRQTYTWLDPATHERNEEVTIYDKWRNAGFGVMWPFTIERERNGYKTYQSFCETVEVDKSLPAKIFDLPPGITILKKVD